jgi:metal-sulfur cluster biosynthetic enzyme
MPLLMPSSHIARRVAMISAENGCPVKMRISVTVVADIEPLSIITPVRVLITISINGVPIRIIISQKEGNPGSASLPSLTSGIPSGG